MQKYEDLLSQPMKVKIKMAHLTGIAFGYSLAMRFIMIASLFWIGAKLIIDYELEVKGVYAAQFILFVTAIGAGNSISVIPSAM
jgi:hypothetical protein